MAIWFKSKKEIPLEDIPFANERIVDPCDLEAKVILTQLKETLGSVLDSFFGEIFTTEEALVAKYVLDGLSLRQITEEFGPGYRMDHVAQLMATATSKLRIHMPRAMKLYETVAGARTKTTETIH